MREYSENMKARRLKCIGIVRLYTKPDMKVIAEVLRGVRGVRGYFPTQLSFERSLSRRSVMLSIM